MRVVESPNQSTRRRHRGDGRASDASEAVLEPQITERGGLPHPASRSRSAVRCRCRAVVEDGRAGGNGGCARRTGARTHSAAGRSHRRNRRGTHSPRGLCECGPGKGVWWCWSWVRLKLVGCLLAMGLAGASLAASGLWTVIGERVIGERETGGGPKEELPVRLNAPT